MYETRNETTNLGRTMAFSRSSPLVAAHERHLSGSVQVLPSGSRGEHVISLDAMGPHQQIT
jgi:hypothetical protein